MLCLLLLCNIRCVWYTISKLYLNSMLSVLHYKAVSSTQIHYEMYWDTISSKLYLNSTSSHRLQGCAFYSFTSSDVLRYYIIFIFELNFEPSFIYGIRLCLLLFLYIRCIFEKLYHIYIWRAQVRAFISLIIGLCLIILYLNIIRCRIKDI